jgi:hypothetical protein
MSLPLHGGENGIIPFFQKKNGTFDAIEASMTDAVAAVMLWFAQRRQS